MRFRKTTAAIAALVSLFLSQTASFAGMASKNGMAIGHVHYFGSKKLHVNQPAPIQTTSYVNVRDFGATGDGVTDDTATIQNAIAAAQASGQGVLFPAGTYLHTQVITANGVGLIGVGAASVLLANNSNASAVILTGASPSIQNLIANSVPAGGGGGSSNPAQATVAVQGAQGFVVQNITIVQGQARPGVLLQQSSIGQVSAVTFNGSGSIINNDIGVFMLGCVDVSILGNLFLNEAGNGIQLGTGISNEAESLSIAIIGNSISADNPITAFDSNTIDVSQNQLAASRTGITVGTVDNFSVTGNTISSAVIGMNIQAVGSEAGIISQNTIRNCQGRAALLNTAASGSIQFTGNQIGECGTTAIDSVIVVEPGAGSGSIVVLNNVYAGHANNLQDYIQSAAALAFVAGNVQTQTTLPNSIP